MTHARNLEFEPVAFEDLAWWVNHDRKNALRILRILEETRANPFEGIGKPEPLKFELTGCWSRRIYTEHVLSTKFPRTVFASSLAGITTERAATSSPSTHPPLFGSSHRATTARSVRRRRKAGGKAHGHLRADAGVAVEDAGEGFSHTTRHFDDSYAII